MKERSMSCFISGKIKHKRWKGDIEVKSYIKELWKQMQKDDISNLSAQCAYYFLFSLFPFLLFVMSLLGFLPFSTDEVLALIHDYVPESVLAGMEENLRNILDVKRGGTLSLGLVISLIMASAAMNSIVLAVNKAYGLPERKSFIHSRFIAILLTLGMLLVVCSALLLSVFGHCIGDFMHTYLRISMDAIQLWNVLRWVVNFVILFVVFTAIYYVAPNTCLTCKDVIPGSLIAAAGWQLASLGFSYYVSNWGNYNATYGSLGGVIVLMTWFYLSAFVIILGGEVNALSYLFRHKDKA
jgi:membrane protein